VSLTFITCDILVIYFIDIPDSNNIYFEIISNRLSAKLSDRPSSIPVQTVILVYDNVIN